MNDRFQELTVFVRAADTGSFSATARDLGLSQPSVSRIISELESRPDIKLLLRSTRRVVPTDAGTAYLRKARQILLDLDDADDVARGTDSVRGSLRVAMPSVLCSNILIPALPQFMRDHPQLKLHCLTSDNMQDLVSDGVDLAIRFGNLRDSAFGARKLASLERAVLCSPAYLAARGTPHTPADLAGHDTIVGPGTAGSTTWRFEREDVADAVTIVPRYQFNPAEAAIASAIAGLVFARAAVPMCREALAAGRLVAVLSSYQLEPVDLHAVYPGGARAV